MPPHIELINWRLRVVQIGRGGGIIESNIRTVGIQCTKPRATTGSDLVLAVKRAHVSRISCLSSERKFRSAHNSALCEPRHSADVRAGFNCLAYGVWPTLGQEQPTSPRECRREKRVKHDESRPGLYVRESTDERKRAWGWRAD